MVANWRLAEILGAVRNSGSAMSFQSVMTSARTVVAASRTPTVRLLIFVFMSVCLFFRKRVTTTHSAPLQKEVRSDHTGNLETSDLSKTSDFDHFLPQVQFPCSLLRFL